MRARAALVLIASCLSCATTGTPPEPSRPAPLVVKTDQPAQPPAPSQPPADPPAPSQPAATPAPCNPMVQSCPPEPNKVTAAHILVQWAGSMRARAEVTRSKDEALAIITKVRALAVGGRDFAELAAQYSDEPGAAARGGNLGSFKREHMVKPFGDAAFALRPGELSGIVETHFGYHIILRVQ